jgi:antitoxin (DNA-binding transcriptional repressor) of toxin-antitoxin stability system
MACGYMCPHREGDMRAVGIRELKDHLSEYVRIANSGEVVLVTDRDRVVAELVRPGGRSDRGDALWSSLVADGVVRPALVCDGSPPPYVGGSSATALADELAQDRADR